MRTQLSSKESRWCNCGKQILTTDLRFIDKGVHICCECRSKELNAMKDEEKQTVASPIEPVVMLRLKEERVVSFKKRGDGTFRVQERCDRYFAEYLNRDEMLMLAQEIIDLAT